MKLVFIDNNRPVTDSITVAEVFGKEHARVLRDIRELACSDEFRVGNFAESTYINGQGREMPKFLITEQGFSILVMGYTGRAAMEFKEKYIREFHEMRSTIESNKVVPLSERQALIQTLRLTAELAEEMDGVKAEIQQLKEAVEEQITIDHGEQRRVQKAVARRIYEMTGNDLPGRREMFQQVYREIKDRWAVASYRDIRRNEIDQVLHYINAWMPRKVS